MSTTETTTPAPRRGPRSRRARLGALIAGLVVLAVVVAGVLLFQSHQRDVEAKAAAAQAEEARVAAATAERQRLNVLVRAGAGCDLLAYKEVGYELADSGTTMSLVTKGNDNTSSITTDDLACVLEAVNAPGRVTSLMDSTRALDGRQTDAWDDITATWSYHPDSGFNLVLAVA